MVIKLNKLRVVPRVLRRGRQGSPESDLRVDFVVPGLYRGDDPSGDGTPCRGVQDVSLGPGTGCRM